MVPPRRPGQTLTQDDWIAAAYRRFAEGGLDAVRVEALARDLGVSKGSFYWHFRDRAALLTAFLARWEAVSLALIRGAGEQPTPRARLRHVLTQIFAGGTAVVGSEISFLAWSRHDPQAARVAARVEEQRLAFLAGQLQAGGLPPERAWAQAELLYAALLGYLDRLARQATDLSPGAFLLLLTALLPEDA